MEGELTDLLGLLSEIADRVELLEAQADEPVGVGVTGPDPGAEENRAIAGARAALARREAIRMRVGLDEIRAQARRMADSARDARFPTQGPAPRGGDRRDAAVAHRFADAEERAEVLRVLLEAVVAALPGATWAGVVGRDGGGLRCEVVTHDLVVDLVDGQAADGAGPVLDVLAGGGAVRVGDVGSEPRWPALAARAASRGVRCLFVRELAARHVAPRAALVVQGAVALPVESPSWRAVDRLADQAVIALAGLGRRDLALRGMGPSTMPDGTPDG